MDLVLLGVMNNLVNNWLWSGCMIQVESLRRILRSYFENFLGGLIDGGAESNDLFAPGKSTCKGEQELSLSVLGLEDGVSD